jgi:hypothetical protein
MLLFHNTKKSFAKIKFCEEKLLKQTMEENANEGNYQLLINRKDDTIKGLNKDLKIVGNQLSKFKNAAVTKLKAMEALNEQNEVTKNKEVQELFDVLMDQMQGRVETFKDKLNEMEDEKEDFFELLQEKPDNVVLTDIIESEIKSSKDKKRKKRSQKKEKKKDKPKPVAKESSKPQRKNSVKRRPQRRPQTPQRRPKTPQRRPKTPQPDEKKKKSLRKRRKRPVTPQKKGKS